MNQQMLGWYHGWWLVMRTRKWGVDWLLAYLPNKNFHSSSSPQYQRGYLIGMEEAARFVRHTNTSS